MQIQSTLVFLKALLAHPRQIGAVIPSGRPLSRAMARAARYHGGYVVELGAGTGSVTEALLESGVPIERLISVELEPTLAAHLRQRFPGLHVLEGDARDLRALLPAECLGQIPLVVSSLPLRGMPDDLRDAIVAASLDVLNPGGQLIQYTYPPFSPLPRHRLGLAGRKVERIFANVPPAAVWRFQRV